MFSPNSLGNFMEIEQLLLGCRCSKFQYGMFSVIVCHIHVEMCLYQVEGCTLLPTSNCIKHFHWLMGLFWPIRFDVTIVSIGNNCNVQPDWPESPLGTVVKSNLIG